MAGENMTIPRIYICGPMTGLPQHNHPVFNRAAFELATRGYQVFNPAENGLPVHAEWSTHMRVDIVQMMHCHAIATLPGWENSKGAQLEVHIAQALGMPIKPHAEWLINSHTVDL